MSRDVNLNNPLSEEDVAYLVARERFREIEMAEQIHGVSYGTRDAAGVFVPSGAGSADANTEDGDQDDAEWVESLTVPQLKEEIAKIEPDATVTGLRKEDLQAKLLELLDEGDDDSDDSE